MNNFRIEYLGMFMIYIHLKFRIGYCHKNEKQIQISCGCHVIIWH